MKTWNEWVDEAVAAMEQDISDAIWRELTHETVDTPTQTRVSKVLEQFQQEAAQSIEQWKLEVSTPEGYKANMAFINNIKREKGEKK